MCASLKETSSLTPLDWNFPTQTIFRLGVCESHPDNWSQHSVQYTIFSRPEKAGQTHLVAIFSINCIFSVFLDFRTRLPKRKETAIEKKHILHAVWTPFTQTNHGGGGKHSIYSPFVLDDAHNNNNKKCFCILFLFFSCRCITSSTSPRRALAYR